MKFLKNYFLWLLLNCCLSFSYTYSSYGQLIIDTGKDTTYCSDPNTIAIPMDLKVNIQNGVEPYTFAWECKIVPYGILTTKTADDILNDSTLISPTLIKGVWLYTDKIKFILYVTDNAGNLGKDSIQVAFSHCKWVLGYQVVELNKGDSVLLNAGISQENVASYYWTPREGLSTPDSSATWCKPNASTDYYINRLDTSGCTCTNHAYEIRVITTSSNIKLDLEEKINSFQKGSKVYFNNTLQQQAWVYIFSLDGNLVYQSHTFADYIELSSILPKSGQYIVKISIEDKIEVCKFLKY